MKVDINIAQSLFLLSTYEKETTSKSFTMRSGAELKVRFKDIQFESKQKF